MVRQVRGLDGEERARDLELVRYRAEAATLLGLTDLPADVFVRP